MKEESKTNLETNPKQVQKQIPIDSRPKTTVQHYIIYF